MATGEPTLHTIAESIPAILLVVVLAAIEPEGDWLGRAASTIARFVVAVRPAVYDGLLSPRELRRSVPSACADSTSDPTRAELVDGHPHRIGDADTASGAPTFTAGVLGPVLP